MFRLNQGHEFCSALHLLNIIMCCFWHVCLCIGKVTPHKNAYKDDRSRVVNPADCQLLLFFFLLFLLSVSNFELKAAGWEFYIALVRFCKRIKTLIVMFYFNINSIHMQGITVV